jgi:hypothetical protein
MEMNSKKCMMSGNDSGIGMNTSPMNMMMIPRTTMNVEKCDNGMKIMCNTQDANSCEMIEHLCSMLSGSTTSMCMMMNGMEMMNCNMIMGMCKCEMTEQGMCINWSSGDSMMCDMIHECCDCIMHMMECGCTSIICMNNTAICRC